MNMTCLGSGCDKPSDKTITLNYSSYYRNRSYTATFCSAKCRDWYKARKMCATCGYPGSLKQGTDGKVYCLDNPAEEVSCYERQDAISSKADSLVHFLEVLEQYVDNQNNFPFRQEDWTKLYSLLARVPRS
jgi:hypothetical protein